MHKFQCWLSFKIIRDVCWTPVDLLCQIARWRYDLMVDLDLGEVRNLKKIGKTRFNSCLLQEDCVSIVPQWFVDLVVPGTRRFRIAINT